MITVKFDEIGKFAGDAGDFARLIPWVHELAKLSEEKAIALQGQIPSESIAEGHQRIAEKCRGFMREIHRALEECGYARNFREDR